MTQTRNKILFSVLFIVSIFYMPTPLGAVEISLEDADVSVDLIPENPEPYQDVTVKITSYATDLNRAFIEWRSGSNLILSGYGKTSYSFTAPGPNVSTVLDVNITPSDGGGKITKRVVVSPSEIEIMWEAVDGYTPPFYRGKSYITREGRIKAVAIPNTGTSGKISYTWKSGDNTVLGASGYNKDSYTFKNSELNTSESVTVSASSVDGRYNATKTISIPIVEPKIIFYKKSPTEGILYNNALTNETYVEGEEMTMVAEPYFLAIKGNENEFTYSWKINGKEIETPSRKTQLTIHPASRGGYATIDLVLENLSTFFQSASGQLKLNL